MELLREPNTVYVDLVAIETAEPREGDLRYAGEVPDDLTGWHPNDVMGVRVLTLSGETTQDGSPLLASSSNVFKISTPLLGSGTPYTPLADGEATNNGNSFEGFTVFRDEENNLSREKLENARYEAAPMPMNWGFIWQIRALPAPSITSLRMCGYWSTAMRYSSSTVSATPATMAIP